MFEPTQNQSNVEYANLIGGFKVEDLGKEKASQEKLSREALYAKLTGKGVSMETLVRDYSVDYNKMPNNILVEQMVNTICGRTWNEDREFFRLVTCYFLTKIASNMRCSVTSKSVGRIPVNMYSILLGRSGYGKNRSVHILEGEYIGKFTERFMEQTYESIAEANINKKFYGSEQPPANMLPEVKGGKCEGMVAEPIDNPLKKELEAAGPFVFGFDSGTTPAIKQFKNSLALSGVGAISCEMDEIGSNLSNNLEMMNLFLELYDVGQAKTKMIKNTGEQKREADRGGNIPTNMLLFGTPSRLFDNDSTEELFWDLLETGYARRCFFALGERKKPIEYFKQDPREMYLKELEMCNDDSIEAISSYLAKLADKEFYGWNITVPDSVEILLNQYKLDLETKAEALDESRFIERSELENRYFKVIKLAGVFSFIRGSKEMGEQDFLEAASIAEKSGEALYRILHQDKGYMKVAKFINAAQEPITTADLQERFPWFKGTKVKETLYNASAWGLKNDIVIKSEKTNGIDLYSTVKLEKTNLDELIFSVSQNMAQNFNGGTLAFNQIERLTNYPNLNICNHTFKDNYRDLKHCEEDFNCIVFDVDGGLQVDSFKELFHKYKYFLHETKSSTLENNRFRVYVPTKYKLRLSTNEYKEFMANVMDMLPFKIDEMSCVPSQMWASTPGKPNYLHEEGELFDPLPFIEGTFQNTNRKEQIKSNKTAKLDKVEAWFVKEMDIGNRNKMLLRYAYMMVDRQYALKDIEKAVLSLNEKQAHPLDIQEIKETIMVSVKRRFDGVKQSS